MSEQQKDRRNFDWKRRASERSRISFSRTQPWSCLIFLKRGNNSVACRNRDDSGRRIGCESETTYVAWCCHSLVCKSDSRSSLVGHQPWLVSLWKRFTVGWKLGELRFLRQTTLLVMTYHDLKMLTVLIYDWANWEEYLEGSYTSQIWRMNSAISIVLKKEKECILS